MRCFSKAKKENLRNKTSRKILQVDVYYDLTLTCHRPFCKGPFMGGLNSSCEMIILHNNNHGGICIGIFMTALRNKKTCQILNKNTGSISVSGQQPTYPSTNPTLTLTCCQLTVVELREG